MLPLSRIWLCTSALLTVGLVGCPNPNNPGDTGVLPGDSAVTETSPDVPVDVPLPALSVEWVTPTEAEVFTNAPMDLRVNVNNGTADRVELLKDGVVFATLTGPSFTHRLAVMTNETSRAVYTVRATRGSETFLSPERIVNVDTVVPTVVSMSPTTSSLIREPFSITFSEAMPADVMRAQNVTVVANVGMINVPLAVDAVASSDMRTLTMQAKDPWMNGLFPDMMVRAGVQLMRASDRAGNAIDPLPSWSWDVLPWRPLAQTVQQNTDSRASNEFDVRVDSRGRVVMVWNEMLSDNSQRIYVKRSNAMGGFDTLDAAGINAVVGLNPVLVIGGNDEPILVWKEIGNVVKVRRWSETNSRWQLVGTQANPLMPGGTPIGAGLFAVAVKRNGEPIVAMTSASGTTLYAMQWDGNNWVPSDPALNGVVLSPGQTTFNQIAIAVDPNDRPGLAITGSRAGGQPFVQFQRLSGVAWVTASGVIRDQNDPAIITNADPTRAPGIEFESTGTPVLSALSNGMLQVWVAPNNAWAPLPALPNVAGRHILRVDRSDNRVAVAFLTSGALSVKERVGTASTWSDLAPAFNPRPTAFALDIRRPESILPPAMSGSVNLLGAGFGAPVVLSAPTNTAFTLWQASR